MTKVIEIRKVVVNLIKKVSSNVYFQMAPDDATFPYFVFDLPNSVDNGYLEQFVLDVDGWDNSADTAAIETLMDTVDQHLDGMTVTVNGLIMSIYLDNRLALVDDAPLIKHRKYVYQVRTYERR